MSPLTAPPPPAWHGFWTNSISTHQAWRLLTRSFLPESERGTVLAYSPMFHARLFADSDKYRDSHFQPTRATISPAHVRADDDNAAASSENNNNNNNNKPYLDGHPALDRPLFVQFCANDPQALLAAAQLVAPHCDAVDLNFGCPQGIARKGRYGAFLQEDQALVHALVKILHEHLAVPVTAKIRVLDTREATLAYARNVLAAGASILTVHGRRREQKGHLTGVADWAHVRYLRDHLPPETVLFANGNVLQHGDLRRCLDATGADGVMSAEGNLSDPAVFAPPPPPPLSPADGANNREYWRGRDGRGGYRVDAIMRRYLDIMHRYVLEQPVPARRPLFVPGDDESWLRAPTTTTTNNEAEAGDGEEPARKKRRKEEEGAGGGGGGDKKKKKAAAKAVKHTSGTVGPNFVGMQAHLFHLLRHFVTRHHDVRDALARARLGDVAVYEALLDTVERRVAEGLLAYERTGGRSWEEEGEQQGGARNGAYAKGSRGDNGSVGVPKKNDDGDGVGGNAAAAAAAPTTAHPAGAAAAVGEEDKAGGGGGQEANDNNNKQEKENKNDDADDDIDIDPDSSVATVRRCKRPWWVAQPIVRPLPKEALAKGAVSLSKKEKKQQQKMTMAEQEQEQQEQEKKKKAAPVPGEPVGGVVNGEASNNGGAAGQLEETTDFPKSSLVSG